MDGFLFDWEGSGEKLPRLVPIFQHGSRSDNYVLQPWQLPLERLPVQYGPSDPLFQIPKRPHQSLVDQCLRCRSLELVRWDGSLPRSPHLPI